MENEESKSRIIEKTQLKRDTFRVLGRPVSDLHSDKDVQIFNDFDFYKVLLSDFLQSNENEGNKNDVEDELSETERHLLGNADLSITQKFIRKRQKMLDAAGQHKKMKQVDTKASKNRKIQYVVHDKIVNFTTPLDNLVELEGRDAIVKNLFGANTEV